MGTAAVVPYLTPLASTTATNPINASGFGSPGQQIRVFVNDVEQDFVRTFATGNPAIPTNPFVVPANGAFSVPVVLDDGINRVHVTAISSGSVESAASNESVTKYENLIPRGTSNPLRILPPPTPDDPNSEEISAGQIFVLTKGDMPGFTAEYYLDRHLEARENALLVIGAGADLRFAGPTPYKRKIIVSGTLRTRGTASNRARTYHTSPTSVVLNYWDGIEIRSTSRGTSLSGISIRNTSKAIAVTGTVSSRPDLELRDSAIGLYNTTGVEISTAGQITISGNEFQVGVSGTGPCSRDGLVATESTSITISKNLLIGARYGFTAVDTPALIEENELDPGSCSQSSSPLFGAAIRVTGSVGTTAIRRNTTSQFVPAGDILSAAGVRWRAGILIENSSPTVEDNALFDAVSGVEVLTSGGGSASPLVRRNTFDRIAANLTGWSNVNNPDNIHGAVVLRDGAGGTIEANRISNLWSFNFGRGVFVRNAGASAIQISDNEILRMYIGIHVHNAAIPLGESIVARRNSIGYSNLAGIYVTRSDATVEDSVVRGTQNSPAQAAGIYLFETTALVQRNSVRDAQYGVRATGGHPEIASNHLAANYRGGILVEATEAGTLIRGNRIEEHRSSSGGVFAAGIIVRHSGASTAGTQVTIDGGNIITGNYVGIRIEGLPNSATGQPVPIVTGNSIYDNAYLTTLQNVQIDSYSTPSQTTLDVSDNWWNTTNQADINARILYVSPPGAGFQPIADIDFPNVVTAPNTSFFVGALSATVGGVSTRTVYFEPDPGAPSPPLANIGFKVYDPGASVVVRICPELAPVCNAAAAVFASPPQTFPVGPASVSWNGTDGTGKAVAPEAYVYQLEATKGSVTQVVDSPIRDAFALGALITPPGAPTSYDGYRNEPFKLKYANLAAGNYGPMRILFDVQPRDAAGELVASERSVVGPEGFPSGQPVPAAPGSAKIPYLVWPSRSSTGEIISGSTLIEVRPGPMRYHVIIVAGTAPGITRDTGELNLVAEPRLVYDTFEQIAAVRYRVNRPADVVISLLPPASWDDTSAPTWRFLNVPANTGQLFEFRGHEVLGMDGVTADSARQLVTALEQEGAFTFRVRATDLATSRTTETLATVQVRH